MSERKLEGGRSYKLSNLFSGEHRAIIIPDLQRDYCWGDPIHTSEHKDLVRDFLINLIELFESVQTSSVNSSRDEDFNLGLIYGYEQPLGQIQLCDGQQRITTLYLLIGMLNRYLGDDSLKRCLISEYEENDDKEPYLRYSIRESSLYFMSDLVCRFFIRGVEGVWPLATDKIRECEWYYNDYDQDPSIQSMLRAVVIIETTISQRADIDWRRFADFILNRLTLLYYDMGTRENGEETFVVINTTGEPLSAAQNLKPKIVYEKINAHEDKLLERWEEMETWFWVHRANGNDTSDVGLGEFLRWVTIFHYIRKFDEDAVSSILESESGAYTFPVREIPFSDIYSTFTAVKSIYEKYYSLDDALANKNYLSMGGNGRLQLIDLYKFLPVVRYVERFEDINVSDVRRVFRYFLNLSQYLSKEITVKNRSLSQAVGLVDAMTDRDILSFLNCGRVSKHILPDEERRKLSILSNSTGRREEVEEAFWTTQKFRVFQGEISPLLNWASEDGVFRFESFKTYAAKISEVFETNDNPSLDLARRAMVSYNLDGYPVRNGRNLSFCGEDWQWKKVVVANPTAIQRFLDELIEGVDMYTIIDRCETSNKWYDIVHDACALAYCEYKNVQEDQTEGIILIKRKNATTWFPMNLLKDTRERFGAEQILELPREPLYIGFTRTIDGRLRYLQRWLSPRKDEVDLYLMRSEDCNSYIYGDNRDGENDLEKFRCMRVTDEMRFDEITKGIQALIAKCTEAD